MIDQRFVILGALLSFCTVTVYVRRTLRGDTQPNRITWLLWALAPMIAFAAELKAHAGLSALMTFSVGFNPLLVLVASFVNSKASWRISTFDYVCGALSVAGTIAWLLTEQADVALGAAIAADALAALPTVRKAVTHPASESRSVYAGGVINSSIALLATQRFDAADAAFPFYILVLNLGILLILARRSAAARPAAGIASSPDANGVARVESNPRPPASTLTAARTVVVKQQRLVAHADAPETVRR